MNISITKNRNLFVQELDFELVERKGVGHPDTISDAIAETASRNYSQYCIKHFGKPAHHWFDKVMLVGGEADVEFGHGMIVKPYTIIYAGKVSNVVGDVSIPVDKILFDSAAEVLNQALTGFDQSKHMTIVNYLADYQGAGRKEQRYRPASVEELPLLESESLVSNDTNLLSGYAPLSILEQVVYNVEQYVNGKQFKIENPDTGWDVKVFGSRKGNQYNLLVNMPFLAKDILSIDQYFSRKAEVQNQINLYLKSHFDVEILLTMNATDKNGRAYLTALGSVADTGDVGVVGRGNRLNGLITPMRPMSIEAPAGKNPIDHTGKLYGVLAMNLAKAIYKAIRLPVEVHIFTAKESKLNDPDEIIVKLNNWNDENISGDNILIEKINTIINSMIKNVGTISKTIIFDGIAMW